MGHPFFRIYFSMSVLLVSVGLSSAQISSSSPIPNDEFAQRLSAAGGDGMQTPQFPQQGVSQFRGNNASFPGHISGTVLDQSGAVVVGAKVRLSHEERTSTEEVSSGNNGQFSFADVSPGFFQLTIESAGFGNGEFAGTLPSGQTYFVPAIVLSVATAVTEVRVKVAANQVEEAEAQIKEQEKQRVLGFIPNFYVSYVPDAVPLSTKQKFKLAWKSSTDPMTFFGIGLIAGLEQATDAFSGYGQGAQGYAKRFSATYTDMITGTFIGSAILPSVLKQDPRYFYKGTGSVGSRLLYSLGSTVFCKGDNQRWQPNYSNVIGSFAAGGLSSLYYPASDRNGAGLIIQNSLIRLGETAFTGVLQEFIVRRLTPHLRRDAQAQETRLKQSNEKQ
jgi:hypothetical protein